MKMRKNDVTDLLNKHKYSNYGEIELFLEHYDFDDVDDILSIIYNSAENDSMHTIEDVDPIAKDNMLQNIIAMVKKEFPDIDDEICELFIKEGNYDIETILSNIRTSFRLNEEISIKNGERTEFQQIVNSVSPNENKDEINKAKKNELLKNLNKEYPHIDNENLGFYLEAAAYDLEYAKRLINSSPSNNKPQNVENYQSENIESNIVSPEMPSISEDTKLESNNNSISIQSKPNESQEEYRQRINFLRAHFPNKSKEIIITNYKKARGNLQIAMNYLCDDNSDLEKRTIKEELNDRLPIKYTVDNRFNKDGFFKNPKIKRKNGITKYKIDLHTIDNKSAKAVLTHIGNLVHLFNSQKIVDVLKIITGKGKHSIIKNNSTLKPMVKNYLKSNKIKNYIPKRNEGIIICKFN